MGEVKSFDWARVDARGALREAYHSGVAVHLIESITRLINKNVGVEERHIEYLKKKTG